MSAPDQVKVTQADRDFASRWASFPHDHAPLAKDAARHRTTATDALLRAYDELRLYIYDSDAKRREWAIAKHEATLSRIREQIGE
jgi:hypothetical protein